MARTKREPLAPAWAMRSGNHSLGGCGRSFTYGRGLFASCARAPARTRACPGFACVGALHSHCYRLDVRYRLFFVHAVQGPAPRVFSSVLHQQRLPLITRSLRCGFTRQRSQGLSGFRYGQRRDTDVCDGSEDTVAAPGLFLRRHLIKIPTGRQCLTRPPSLPRREEPKVWFARDWCHQMPRSEYWPLE